jgi:hypothetical protein
MHSKAIISAISALFVLGNAVPLNNDKRDLVYVTEIETAIETVPITTTVWVDPTDVPVAPKSKNHKHGHKHSSSSQAAVEAQPTPSSSASEVYVAPSSYEASSTYVEPTTTSAPESATTAQAEQTTSTPEPSTTEAAVTPESSYVAPVSSYEAPSSTYVTPVSSYVTPSSTYEAPSSTYEAPSSTYVTPSSIYEAPSSTSEAAAASSAPASYGSGSSGSDSSNPASGKSYTGEMTYFTPGMGACGETSSETDHMVAVSMALFDQYTPNGNPNKNPLCGKTVTIQGKDGASHEATIWDRCVGCAEADLDMPEAFFNTVTSHADGRAYGMAWSMN